MKTPKRTCRDCLFFTSYSSADPDGRCGEGCGTYGTHTKGSEAACNAFMLSSAAKSARWKRKNRIAQLKRTINKYRDCTNLPFYCHEMHAYKRLQELRMPGKKATPDDWENYESELRCIRCHLTQAVNKAERAKERAERKEHP